MIFLLTGRFDWPGLLVADPHKFAFFAVRTRVFGTATRRNTNHITQRIHTLFTHTHALQHTCQRTLHLSLTLVLAPVEQLARVSALKSFGGE